MIVEVKLENVYSLKSFKSILEKYRDYKLFYRELKINSLLGNKSQFDIEEINPPLVGGLEDNDNSLTFRLKNSAFLINSMSYVVDKDLNVVRISLDIKIMETPNGKILLDLLKIGHTIDFRPLVMHQLNDVEIIGFHACSKLKLSA